MRKCVYVICDQQRRRSACASAQSDHHLCFRCLDSMICILAISKVSRFYLASVAEQACLNLTWSKISVDTFLRDLAQMEYLFQLLTEQIELPMVMVARYVHKFDFTSSGL